MSQTGAEGKQRGLRGVTERAVALLLGRVTRQVAST